MYKKIKGTEAYVLISVLNI